jgi:hypothetical protein
MVFCGLDMEVAVVLEAGGSSLGAAKHGAFLDKTSSFYEWVLDILYIIGGSLQTQSETHWAMNVSYFITGSY